MRADNLEMWFNMVGSVHPKTIKHRRFMPAWIDFKELREKLSFEAVLQHYGVEPKVKNGQHLGYCPLPSHEGKRNSPSFSANMDRKIFHCFGCQAKGNVLDFAALMEKADPKDGRSLKKIAVELRSRFCPETGGGRVAKRAKEHVEQERTNQLELSAIVNQPLDFELQGLDPAHSYLLGRGFTKETASHFGIGYCERGSLAGRIAIPLHDATGKLVGYAGRVVDDDSITEENPRYRFPSMRERDGKRLAFKKTLFLYNGFHHETRGAPRCRRGLPVCLVVTPTRLSVGRRYDGLRVFGRASRADRLIREAEGARLDCAGWRQGGREVRTHAARQNRAAQVHPVGVSCIGSATDGHGRRGNEGSFRSMKPKRSKIRPLFLRLCDGQA
jgi:hypothetical protein